MNRDRKALLLQWLGAALLVVFLVVAYAWGQMHWSVDPSMHTHVPQQHWQNAPQVHRARG